MKLRVPKEHPLGSVRLHLTPGLVGSTGKYSTCTLLSVPQPYDYKTSVVPKPYKVKGNNHETIVICCRYGWNNLDIVRRILLASP